MTGNRTIRTMKHCQECKQRAALYQCPRCARITCSLACCQVHKEKTGCSGKRDRTTFRRLEEMNDAALQSDFFFLEDVLRQVDGSKRVLKQVGVGTTNGKHDATNNMSESREHPMLQLAAIIAQDTLMDPTLEEEGASRKRQKTHESPLPPKWRRLVQQAHERKITLLLMPPGMERHKSNTTFHNVKNDTLHWKVEFVCHLEKQILLTCNKLQESATLSAELIRLMQDRNIDIDVKDMHLLLKKLPCPANHPRYVQIANDQTLNEAMAGMTVIEYPTIDVVMTKDLSKFPLTIVELVDDGDHEGEGGELGNLRS